ncbi:MAG: 2-phosphosulfolactate phosphatase [Firmicutes bacterium]|nr:2-phosphosulfolactate phosphatase [Bacillota bacterium]
MKVDVAFLPGMLAGKNLSDTVCIVLDIFRATTCMVTAFFNGCNAIIPVLSLDEAHVAAEQTGPVLLAGERQSLKMDGCDLGNSPFDFCRDNIAGQTVVMTTSNGTVAVKATDTAYRTMIGSFLNAGAVCQKAKKYGKDIVVVCAGTDRAFSLEDALCAGLLVQLLAANNNGKMTDSAEGVLLMYREAKPNLLTIAAGSRNGRRLCELGRTKDMEYCLQTDLLDIVPYYANGKITLSETNKNTVL